MGAYDCAPVLPLLITSVVDGTFEESRQALALIEGIETELSAQTWSACRRARAFCDGRCDGGASALSRAARCNVGSVATALEMHAVGLASHAPTGVLTGHETRLSLCSHRLCRALACPTASAQLTASEPPDLAGSAPGTTYSLANGTNTARVGGDASERQDTSP